MVSCKYLSERYHRGIPVGSHLPVTDALIRNTAVHEKDGDAGLPRQLCIRLDPFTRYIIADDSTGFIRDGFRKGFRLFFRSAFMGLYDDIVTGPSGPFKDYVLHLGRKTCFRRNNQIYDRYIALLGGHQHRTLNSSSDGTVFGNAVGSGLVAHCPRTLGYDRVGRYATVIGSTPAAAYQHHCGNDEGQ